MIIPKADRLKPISEFFFSRKLREVAKLNAEGRDIINLGPGGPDLAPSKETIQALTASASFETNHRYQPYTGVEVLRKAIAEWYDRTYDVKLDHANQVLPLLGSKEGVLYVSLAFLNPGDKVLIPDPGYGTYSTIAKLLGAEPVYYNLNEETNWLPDLERLADSDLRNVKMFWINYPHMPTGSEASRADFAKMVEFAREHQMLLCNDNPYSMILNRNEPLSLLSVENAFDCCLEMNSLSKSHNMSGWRVGMVLGHEDYLSTILTVKSNNDSGMFLPVQHAAVEALKNPADWHAQLNKIYAARREKVYKIFDLLNCNYALDKPGLFVWAKAPDEISDIEKYLDEILYDAGVFLTPGKIFGKNGDRYIRSSLCVPEATIDTAISRINKFISL